MDLRFSRFEILTGTGALFLCLVFVVLFVEAPDIQESIATEASGAVRQQGIYWAAVQAYGQHLVLTGAAPDPQARQQAELAALAVPGVVALDNRMRVVGARGACQTKLDALLEKHPVTFKAGRPDLGDSSPAVLDRVAAEIKRCGTRFEVAGHTDAEGDAVINQKLSQRRAEVVVRYLVQRGVEPERLQPAGYGETQPLADNRTQSGRAANRRLEFRILGDAA